MNDIKVCNFMYSVIIPKLSIRRTRNVLALNNLCSAMFYMSDKPDRNEMLKTSKRIKDEKLKKYFIATWDQKKFKHHNDINHIIRWYNNDESEKPYPRATKIKFYINDDPLWLEKTTRYLESFDNAGYTPRYFKVTAEKAKALKKNVELQKQIQLAEDSNEFDIAKILDKKKTLINDC